MVLLLLLPLQLFSQSRSGQKSSNRCCFHNSGLVGAMGTCFKVSQFHRQRIAHCGSISVGVAEARLSGQGGGTSVCRADGVDRTALDLKEKVSPGSAGCQLSSFNWAHGEEGNTLPRARFPLLSAGVGGYPISPEFLQIFSSFQEQVSLSRLQVEQQLGYAEQSAHGSRH